MEGRIEPLTSCSLFQVAVLKFDVQKLTGCSRQSIQMEMCEGWQSKENMFLRVGIFFFFLMIFLPPHRSLSLITKRKIMKTKEIMKNSTLPPAATGVGLPECEHLGGSQGCAHST